jgi:predicted transglutaminase-like cysteine proteinase
MLKRQQLFEGGQTAMSRQYQDFVSQFDVFKGQSLQQMATFVNIKVAQEITYDNTLHLDTYIASPGETVAARRGNCAAFAALQYDILKHLGVPVNRLFFAEVNASGSDKGTDHAVLLVNIAPDGAQPDFIVLNDGGAVVNAADYQNQATLPQGWNKPYIFYQAVNDDGVWLSPLALQDYYGSGDLVPASGSPVAAARAAIAAKPLKLPGVAK